VAAFNPAPAAMTALTNTPTSGGQGVCYRRAEHNSGKEDHCNACDWPLVDVLNEAHGFTSPLFIFGPPLLKSPTR
jgi:hypothetical protein